MTLYYDLTKAARATHRSGLNRVSARLRDSLGTTIRPVHWDGGWRLEPRGPVVEFRPDDWVLTAELFSEDERPGFGAFLRSRTVRTAAVFYDAIPLRHPEITWPQSVARHPGYMRLLGDCDRVLAISEDSRGDLLRYWSFLGLETPPPVDALNLGADFSNVARRTEAMAAGPAASRPILVCVGILEPRKNQLFLLEVCESLWADGLDFELHLVGRVNPHFGAPVVKRVAALRRKGFPVAHRVSVNDVAMANLHAAAHASVFPTMAEGCGLPVIEALWLGVPCVCSDLPVLRENADGGGCVTARVNDLDAWRAALRRILTESSLVSRLRHEAMTRDLPTWARCADQVRTALTRS